MLKFLFFLKKIIPYLFISSALPNLYFPQNTNFKIENLSIEEKVGQIMMINFLGENPNDAKNLIQEIKVGGIIYYTWANSLNSFKQVQELSLGLQELTKKNKHPIPLFISIDQEGGEITRLTNGFSIFPNNKTLGITNNPEFAKDVAFAMGQELQAVGINMNLAPVVDINNNPKNPIIGSRSFSDNSQTVVNFGKKALEGYKKAKIIATLKHFPGHGDVEEDSHISLPMVSKSLEDLKKIDLLPFEELASFAEAIMTAHIIVPAFDEENCSTLSKSTLTYLRKEIGFEGIIISDSLIMQAALQNCSDIIEAAIKAFNAGCDVLLFGGQNLHNEDIKQTHSSIIDAVRNGDISETRLNESVERILNLKKRYLCSACEHKEIDFEEHKKLIDKITSFVSVQPIQQRTF
jgi:beta-N-acetylhexosaminidase